LSIDEINVRLKDRFKLLTGGSRSALPRQQTLRATLDWSYDLLDAHERTVLNRLGVFSGGFTLAAASAVCSDEAIDEFTVVDRLSHLVARSLVVAETERHRKPVSPARDDAELRAREARAHRRTRASSSTGTRGTFATGVPVRSTIGSPRPMRTGARRICPSGTMCAPRSTGRSVRTAIGDRHCACRRLRSHVERPVALRRGSSMARGGCGANERRNAAGGRSAALALARTQLVARGARSCRAPRWSEPSISIRRLDDTRNLSFALLRLAHEDAMAGRFDRAASLLAEARPLLGDAAPPKVLGDYYDYCAVLKALTGDPAARGRT
jgi:hypothetical protein